MDSCAASNGASIAKPSPLEDHPTLDGEQSSAVAIRMDQNTFGDIPAGEPVKRPPLLRSDETRMQKAGKVVLYVALSPFIVAYLVYDGVRHVLYLAIKYGARAGVAVGKASKALLMFTGDAAYAVGRAVAFAMRTMACVAHDYGYVPLRNAVRALADATYRWVLLPTGRCTLAVWRAISSVLIQGYNGACTVANAIVNATFKFVLVPVAKGLWVVAKAVCWGVTSAGHVVYYRILVPLHAVFSAVARGLWTGTKYLAHGLWTGIKLLVLGVHRYLLSPLWRGSCFVASLLHGRILVPLYHGMLALGRGVRDYVLLPLYHAGVWSLTMSGKALLATGNALRAVLVAAGGAMAAGCKWAYYHVGVPLGAAGAALARGLWRGVTIFASGIYSYVLLPTGRASKAVYYAILVPSAQAVKLVAVLVGGAVWLMASAVAGAASAAGIALGKAANTVYAHAIRPAGLLVVSASNVAARGAVRAAGAIKTGAEAVGGAVKAGTRSIKKGVKQGVLTVYGAANAARAMAQGKQRRTCATSNVPAAPAMPQRECARCDA